jgi:hypothetical protein
MTKRLFGVNAYYVPPEDPEDPPPDPPLEEPGAVLLNASGQSFSRSASGINMSSTDLSWCAWVRMDVSVSYEIVMSSDNGSDKYVQMGASSGGVNFYMSNAGTTPYDFEIGQWVFVGMTADIAFANRYLYWGETPGALTREWYWSSPVSHFDDANTFHIGNDGFGGSRWQGSIAAVKVWNACLTQAEMEDESETYAPVRTSNLWAAYSFKFGVQTTDDSGNGRTLTKNGTPVNDSSGPPIT